MARKALLIGSQTGELSGVDNDLTSMATVLDRWGFASSRCQADNASRAGILDAYEALITDAKADDAIVIYYSGHGGYSQQRDQHKSFQPSMAMQFLVPTDFDKSSEGDFRGIMSVELSVRLARLTEKTKNVTVVLDCCHAAHMSRDYGRGLRVKSLARTVPYHVVVEHFRGLQRRVEPGMYLPAGNPSAVRLVACAPEQSAYEYTNADGVRTGILTEALTKALTTAHSDGLKVSWSTVIDRVREDVLALMPVQRPEAEGPARRLLFDIEEADAVATLPVVVTRAGRVSLAGAPLLGVRAGDEFVVMPPDSSGPDDQTKIGDVVVDDIHATTASGMLRLRSAEIVVPLGARAYHTKASAPAMPILLPGGQARSTKLEQAVEQSPILRRAEPGEHCAVKVQPDEVGQLAIWDERGPMHTPHACDDSGITKIIRNLKRLAWAAGLRGLVVDAAHALDALIDVEFGLVNEGEAQPLTTSGAIVYTGQRIYIRVRNNNKERLYVSLVDIGVSSRVHVLNGASPSGHPVDPGTQYTFGFNDFKGVLQGSRLTWPQGLPRTQPRQETVVILVTSQPQDIRGLEHSGIRGEYLASDQPRSSLERLTDQIDHGGMRDLTTLSGSTMRYTVRTVDFELVPAPPPVNEDPEFQVDERPAPSVLLWSPKGRATANIAVCLSELVVHHNRAFRSADIRLDAVVLTRGPGDQPTYTAWTQRFSNIRDGDTLPLDKVLIYHGQAVDYLDIAVWVSRDTSGSLALVDLLQERLTDSEVQFAMGNLGGLLMAAPQAAVAVAAIGAGAVVINVAYQLLTGIVGNSVGLYRTTLLASEGFGISRPAGQRTIRAQDFSFTYHVEEVS